ncbi:MAG: TMEM175 family protein, partial [Solirubrobacterales bacterium]
MSEQEEIPGLERGRDLSRVVAFTDGVFAIAITLLVLQLDVPKGISSASDLWQQVFVDQGVDFVAFLISGIAEVNRTPFD